MKKKVTIYDLAEMLKISPATVSRSLNNHPSISKKTKDKVFSAANETGYRTNKFAANLSKQKSNTIGVIVPKLNSNFMSTVLSGIEKVANNNGYNLIISQSLESEEKEKMNAKTLYDSGVDALLVSLANETTNYDHFHIYTRRNIPLLFFDRIVELSNCPTILIDNQLAGFDATEHLIQQGCRNILHVGGNLKRNVYRNRYEGYMRAMRKHNLAPKNAHFLETNLDLEKIKDVILFIQQSKNAIDGIFVANDTMAVNCIKELQKVGYKIPQEIKVVGFNNDPVSEIINPDLTTIEYPGYKMGLLAGESIISHLKGSINLNSAELIILRHELIQRESSSNTY